MPDDVQSPQTQPPAEGDSSDPTPADLQPPLPGFFLMLREREIEAKIAVLTKRVIMLRRRLAARERRIAWQKEDLAGLRIRLATQERWDAYLQLAKKLKQPDPPSAEAEIKRLNDQLAMERKLATYLQEQYDQNTEKLEWIDRLLTNAMLDPGERIIAYYARRELDRRRLERRLDGSIPVEMDWFRSKGLEGENTPGNKLSALVAMGAFERTIGPVKRPKPDKQPSEGASTEPAKPKPAAEGPMRLGRQTSLAPGQQYSHPGRWAPAPATSKVPSKTKSEAQPPPGATPSEVSDEGGPE